MSETKYISISLFRVSSDSKYLDMIFSCPAEYYFDSLQLEVRYFDPSDKIMKSKYFDLSAALFNLDKTDPDNTISKKHWTVRLPLEKLGINVPAIYKATLKASPIFTKVINNGSFRYTLPFPYNDGDIYEVRYSTGETAGLVYEKNSDEPLIGYDGKYVYGVLIGHCCKLDCSDQLPPEIDPAVMIASDVNMAYKCMLSDLLNSDNSCNECIPVSDDAIRKYLLLYGHQSALSVGDDEVAERFFKLIVNCFDLCGKKCGCECNHTTTVKKSTCNCGK